MKTDTQHSDQEILNLYFEAENACRESMRYLGDVAFVSVVACRYLQGDMYNSYEMPEQASEIKKECQSTLYNLSQRDDLFSEEQMKVLEMLRKVAGNALWHKRLLSIPENKKILNFEFENLQTW